MAISLFISLNKVAFEPTFNFNHAYELLQKWLDFFPYLAIGYVLLVFGGQKIMKKRDPFDLKYLVATWNLFFSVYSLISAYFLLPNILEIYKNEGVLPLYCKTGDYFTNQTTGYWSYLFVISKTYELGDTLFLVLRKKPVIFMHWYHHILTNFIAVLSYVRLTGWPRLSVFLNVSVHGIMYFYFAVTTLGIRSPTIVRKFITTIQLIQFAIAILFFTHLTKIILSGNKEGCDISEDSHFTGLLMFLSYFYLFGEFFYKSYIKPKKTIKIN
uniref:Elongation of very long chain fatty acids protein n=1 Tax=Strongyloides papillosus TaxID=174720 RepID=A0A0N5BCX9_STREA